MCHIVEFIAFKTLCLFPLDIYIDDSWLARELARYKIDIAALSTGYTFFCMGQPVGQPRQAGIGFAIRTALISQLEQRLQGLSPRLMTMKLHLKHGKSAILISAYTPTMSNDDADKEAFYDHLSSVLRTVSLKERLFLLGNFNARVGRDAQTWPRVLGSALG